MWKYPYVIVNMQTFKSLVSTCQYLVIGEEQLLTFTLITYFASQSALTALSAKDGCKQLCAGEDPPEVAAQGGGHYSRKCSLPSQEFCDQVLLLISLQVTAVLYCTVLYCTVLYCTVLFSAVTVMY